MRKTSVRELHINTSALVREVEHGGTIVIERRGTPVAELRAIPAGDAHLPETRDRILSNMRKLWSRMPQLLDSTTSISDDRDR